MTHASSAPPAGLVFSLPLFLEEVLPACGKATVPRVSVADVGAMDTGERPIWEPLSKAGIADVVGFEPIVEECDRLNAATAKSARGSSHVFLPYALGDGEIGEFRRCSQAMTSSMLEPNIPLLSQFYLLEEVTTVAERSRVQTHRLDDLMHDIPAGRIDFLKLDIQGYELQALKGSEAVLRDALVVHTEVEFVPMYVGQPLFADVDAHLRARGFVFHRFFGVKGVPAKPMALPLAEPPYSQQLWADAVYVRGLWQGLTGLSPPQLLRLALILHEVYMSYDAAHSVLCDFDALVAARYRDHILGRAGPVQSWTDLERAPGRSSSREFSGQRIEPCDGQRYTFAQLTERFSCEFSLLDLQAYWSDTMVPVGGEPAQLLEADVYTRVVTDWDLAD